MSDTFRLKVIDPKNLGSVLIRISDRILLYRYDYDIRWRQHSPLYFTRR